jgi:uncharacterized protein
MKALNKTKGSCVASEVYEARSFLERLKGLLGKSGLKEGEGMLLEPAYQIHTWFMKFAIDVLFLDRDRKIIHLIKDLKPYRVSGLYKSSRSVLELPSGAIEKSKTETGDLIEIA